MRIDIVTVLPGLLKGPFDESIVKRGIEKGLVEVHVHNLRDWSTNKHNKVDDAPFGPPQEWCWPCNPCTTPSPTCNRNGRTTK